MKFTHLGRCGTAAVIVLAGCMTSCIDDAYDLSDIDTTTELKVNDLTVPVQLKDILLDKIIDLDDTDPNAVIKVREVNGQKMYFFSKEGDFHAEPSKIDKVYALKPTFTSRTVTHISRSDIQLPVRRKAAGEYVDFQISRDETDFAYHVGRDGNPKVDKSIKSISDVTLDPDAPLVISMTYHSDALANIAQKIEIENLDLVVPTSLSATWNGIKSANGTLRIPHLETTTGSITINVTVDKANFVTASSPNGKTVVDGMFDFEESIGFAGGMLRVYPHQNLSLSSIPSQIDFTTDYDLSAFTVSKISGEFDIEVDFDEIQTLDLSDIPDFLDGEGTDLRLVNPALTLTVNNPVAQYGLSCTTGLTLSALRSGVAGQTAVLQAFSVGNGSTEQFHVTAPSRDALSFVTTPAGMTPQYTAFPGLGNLLSGNGLPKQINIDFKSSQHTTPSVSGRAVNFPLGQQIAQVNGKYRFETPLAIASGSKIVYSETQDGWNDEDIDAIAISKLKVTATVNTDIPAGATLRIHPVDKFGNRIPLTNEAEAFATMPANAKDYLLSLELLGDIRHLDGIYLEAEVNDFNGIPLSPDQNIRVSNLRASVTGNYIKKL